MNFLNSPKILQPIDCKTSPDLCLLICSCPPRISSSFAPPSLCTELFSLPVWMMLPNKEGLYGYPSKVVPFQSLCYIFLQRICHCPTLSACLLFLLLLSGSYKLHENRNCVIFLLHCILVTRTAPTIPY